MKPDESGVTRETLLNRVRRQYDEESWKEFVFYYRGYVYKIAARMGLNHHDAEEVVPREDELKGLAAQQLHGEVGLAGAIQADLADGHDVRTFPGGGDAGFTHEAAVFFGLADGSRSTAMATSRSVERSRVRRTNFMPPLPNSSPI